MSLKSVLYYLLSRKYENIIWVSNSCYNGYYFHKKMESKSTILYNIVNKKEILLKAESPYDGPQYDIMVLSMTR